MLARERVLWVQGVHRVAGVDEVGVGPLAGPVVAAAVVLPHDVAIDGIRDSKLVAAKRREHLAAEIHAVAEVSIAQVEAADVDRLNIYQATLLAMRLAVEGLAPAPQHLLVDARRVPGTAIPQDGIVGGDRVCYSIAAASIVAKVHRDALMRAYDERYSGYGFARHAGYGTRAHLDALAVLGPSPIHRHSFAPVRSAGAPQRVRSQI